MKALRPVLALILLSLFVYTNSTAQKASFTSPGGLSIGFGAGYTYQKSDLANSMGYGFDFIFGSKLYQKENAFLSVDWKFRFLPGVNKAYDHRINADNTYSNIRYSFFTYDLEVGLTLNRLRERTRIILSGFAGVGITHGRTFTDLYDAGNNLYDFSGIDPNRDPTSVYNDLVALSDGDFETRLVNKAALLPTAGLYLGYQFTRSFAMGIEFKTNLSLTETNSFVGIDMDNRVMSGSGIDRNNYISLGFRWRMGSGRSSRTAANNYSSVVTSSYSNPPVAGGVAVMASGLPPSVIITNPDAASVHTSSPIQTIKANIQNVSGPEDISFIQNGFPNNSFTYNASTQSFNGNVTLREGENTIRIKATNQVSSAEDMVIIALDNPNQSTIAAPVVVVTPPAAYREETYLPMVRFLQPATPVEVSESFFRLRAETRNVGRKNDIDLFVNDAEVHNFAFGDNGIVSVSLFLAEGYNTMEIIATNEAGSASEWTSIVYRKPVYNMPVYQQPAYRPPVSQPVYQEPVAQQPAYRPPVTEEPVTQQPVNRPPASDEPVDAPCRMPVISLIEPVQNQGSTDQQNSTFRAEVFNVHGNQLRLSSNGKPITFNLSNNILSSSVPLVSGPNTILLSATNACGEEKVSARINYVPPVVETPCTSPKLTFSLQEVQRNDATHELRGSVSGVKNKADISLTLDGLAYNGFQYIPSTGNLSAKFKLVPGSHTVVITVSNECGTDTKSETVILEEDEEEEIEEEACGIRINPGNADWQFCLVTPSGTYNRSSLSNSNFSYSGSASSLFIQPIAGGGNAIVNGNPYPLRSGQYYLFTGGLNVQVSTKNPGSMGHWSVCITASSAPISGNGNNRPKSPCESVNDDKSKGNQDDKSKGNQDDKSKGNEENKSQGNQNNRSRGNENDSSTRQNNNKANVKSADSPKASEDERTNRNAGNNTQRTVRKR